MGTRSGRLEGEIDEGLTERANAAGVTLDEVLDLMAVHLGQATTVATVQGLLSGGADALARIFARTFATPEEALAYVPAVVAGTTRAATHGPSAEGVTTDSTTPIFAAPTSEPAREPTASDFANAFRAALHEGLAAAPTETAHGAIVEELFAAAAAGAHALPGGAAAVDAYLRERGRDLKTRRWRNRVRALLHYVGPYRDRCRRLAPPRRVTARRARRRGSHRELRSRSPSATQDGEPPREPPRPPAARARERLPPRGGDL